MNIIAQGLSAQQRNMVTIAGNVNNMGVEGFSKKKSVMVTDSFGTRGSGVQILPEQRLEDIVRTENVREKVVGVAYLKSLADMYQEINRRMGDPSDKQSLGSKLVEVQTALNALETTPNDTSAQKNAVNKFTEITELVSQLASFVQDERLSAENGIHDGVKRVNDILESLHKLNGDISLASGRGEAFGNMKDEQDRLMKDLSQYMDISYLRRDNGTVDITTQNGQALLLRSGNKTVDFNRSTSISPTDTPATLNNIEVDGVNIGTSISSGKIGAFLKARDTILPLIQEGLDEFTVKFTDHINAFHNRGTGFPPPNQLTGTREFADPAVDSIQMTGIVRIGILNSDGTHAFAPEDFDFTGGATTINAVAAAINTRLTVAGSGTCTVTADNRLQITATDPNHGIGIVSMSDPEAVDTTSGKGFSHHFGLNDLLIHGDQYIGSAQGFSVHTDIINNPSRLARGTMSTEDHLVQPDAILRGDHSTVTDMLAAFQDRLAFDARGGLSAQSSSAIDFANNFYHRIAVDGKNNNIQKEVNSDILSASEKDLADRTGVDLLREYEDMMASQQVFSALRRLLQAHSEMLSELTNKI